MLHIPNLRQATNSCSGTFEHTSETNFSLTKIDSHTLQAGNWEEGKFFSLEFFMEFINGQVEILAQVRAKNDELNSIIALVKQIQEQNVLKEETNIADGVPVSRVSIECRH